MDSEFIPTQFNLGDLKPPSESFMYNPPEKESDKISAIFKAIHLLSQNTDLPHTIEAIRYLSDVGYSQEVILHILGQIGSLIGDGGEKLR